MQPTEKDIKEIKESLARIEGTLKFMTNLISPNRDLPYHVEPTPKCTCNDSTGGTVVCPVHGYSTGMK